MRGSYLLNVCWETHCCTETSSHSAGQRAGLCLIPETEESGEKFLRRGGVTRYRRKMRRDPHGTVKILQLVLIAVSRAAAHSCLSFPTQ